MNFLLVLIGLVLQTSNGPFACKPIDCYNQDLKRISIDLTATEKCPEATDSDYHPVANVEIQLKERGIPLHFDANFLAGMMPHGMISKAQWDQLDKYMDEHSHRLVSTFNLI